MGILLEPVRAEVPHVDEWASIGARRRVESQGGFRQGPIEDPRAAPKGPAPSKLSPQ